MYEYIKKLSVTVGILSEKTQNKIFNDELKHLSMSLMNKSAVFLESGNLKNASLYELENFKMLLIQVINVLDYGRILGHVSTMNANLICESILTSIKEIEEILFQKKNINVPIFSLKESQLEMTRDRAKENSQNSYLNVNGHEEEFKKQHNIFTFTNIPKYTPNEVPVEPVLPEVKGVNEVKKIDEKDDKKGAALVYTIFGEVEDKLIDERKAKIMSILRMGGGSLKEISKQMPNLNEKTLQRDLLVLMRERKVIMLGKKRWAKYYLK